MAETLFARAIAALFATSILLDIAAAASYTVGGSSGWAIPPNTTFYSDWSNAQKLVPGDTLVFNFPTGIHNVVKVPKASYDACSAQNQIGSTLSSGPATVTLAATGLHYYICGVSGHCSTGQKLAVTVAVAAAPSPSPSSATAPGSPSPASAPAAQAPTSISPSAVSPETAPSSQATPPTAATSPPPAASAPSDVPVPGSTGTATPPAAPGPSGSGTSSSPGISTAAGAFFLLAVATASLLL